MVQFGSHLAARVTRYVCKLSGERWRLAGKEYVYLPGEAGTWPRNGCFCALLEVYSFYRMHDDRLEDIPMKTTSSPTPVSISRALKVTSCSSSFISHIMVKGSYIEMLSPTAGERILTRLCSCGVCRSCGHSVAALLRASCSIGVEVAVVDISRNKMRRITGR